jgi:hypothetical protein
MSEAEAVSGLEQAIGGIAEIPEGHGELPTRPLGGREKAAGGVLPFRTGC